MELRPMDTALFKALYLVEAGIVVTQVLGRDSLTSLLFLLTFPLTVLLWLRSLRETVTGGDLLVLAAGAASFLSVLLNASAGGANVRFSYLKKWIMFVMSLLFLQTARRTRIPGELTRFLNKIVDGLALFLTGMYFWKMPQMYSLNGQGSVYLTFGLTNPNLTGLFLVCLYMLELGRLFTRERWTQKLAALILALFLGTFTVLTQSRNSLLALTVFTAGWCWVLLRRREEMRFRAGFAALTAVLPGVFVAVYLALVSSPWIQRSFSFLTGAGKGLNSRVTIWKNALGYLRDSPVIGAYFEISHGTGTFQLHNTHLDIAASYGVPVLILVCVLLGLCLYQGGHTYGSKDRCASILGFACAILLGTGEAALFSGGLGIYIWVGTMLLMSNREEEDGT